MNLLEIKKEEIKEQILSVNYYLTQSLIKGDSNEIERLRLELNDLITKYKNLL